VEAGASSAAGKPNGCEHRSQPFAPSRLYAGYLLTQQSSALSKVKLLFTELDAAGVTGRMVFDVGAPSYPELGEAVPANAAQPRPGFDYTIRSGSLIGNHLRFEIALSEPWCALCSEQTAYPVTSSPETYACAPNGQNYRCVDPPTCAWYSAANPTTGAMEQLSAFVIYELCTGLGPCGCTARGCGACGFPHSAACETTTLTFDLTLSEGAISGSVLGGPSGQTLDVLRSDGGLVELDPGRLAAIQSTACVTSEAEAPSGPQVLQWIVDLSEDLARLSSDGVNTNWHVTRDTLLQALSLMPDETYVGLMFFPNTYGQPPICIDTADDVPLGPLGAQGSSHREALVYALSRMEPWLDSSAPTQDAYRNALSNLTGSEVPGNRNLVLVTAGRPTLELGCRESTSWSAATAALIADIESARTKDEVRTFVVSTPGSEADLGHEDARPWLSRAAQAGGTERSSCSGADPNYCQLDLSQGSVDPTELGLTLATVPGLACSFSLPSLAPPALLELDRISLVYTRSDGTRYLLVQEPSDSCVEGWHFAADQAKLEICSNTCQRLGSDPGARIDLYFGCVAPTVQ
jgi:hypothetical protein